MTRELWGSTAIGLALLGAAVVVVCLLASLAVVVGWMLRGWF